MKRKYRNKESKERIEERFRKVKELMECGYTMLTACNRLEIKFATFYIPLSNKEKNELKKIYD